MRRRWLKCFVLNSDDICNHRGQAEREFKIEVEAIGRVRHKNLVRLIGYCMEGSQRWLFLFLFLNLKITPNTFTICRCWLIQNLHSYLNCCNLNRMNEVVFNWLFVFFKSVFSFNGDYWMYLICCILENYDRWVNLIIFIASSIVLVFLIENIFLCVLQDAGLWICWQWKFGAVVTWTVRRSSRNVLGYTNEDYSWYCKRVFIKTLISLKLPFLIFSWVNLCFILTFSVLQDFDISCIYVDLIYLY